MHSGRGEIPALVVTLADAPTLAMLGLIGNGLPEELEKPESLDPLLLTLRDQDVALFDRPGPVGQALPAFVADEEGYEIGAPSRCPSHCRPASAGTGSHSVPRRGRSRRRTPWGPWRGQSRRASTGPSSEMTRSNSLITVGEFLGVDLEITDLDIGGPAVAAQIHRETELARVVGILPGLPDTTRQASHVRVTGSPARVAT